MNIYIFILPIFLCSYTPEETLFMKYTITEIVMPRAVDPPIIIPAIVGIAETTVPSSVWGSKWIDIGIIWYLIDVHGVNELRF